MSKSVTFLLSENNILFRTTTADYTEKLAHYLNIDSGNNYVYLAGSMGYDTTFTGNLKLSPREATQELLKDWQMRDDATVYKLYCYLEELGRDDCMAVLQPLLIGQGSDIAMVWVSVAFSPYSLLWDEGASCWTSAGGKQQHLLRWYLYRRFICRKESLVEH